MDLNSIISQLGIGSKETVYLSVTAGVGLELIELDLTSRTVKNYAYRPLAYNDSLREISDISAFKDAVAELFAELKISLKSNVVLNLPMVLFGNKELPLMLADEAVTEALTSEVEQSYVFKRHEPIVSWVDSSTVQSGDMRKLFYSAMQKNMIDDIKNALTELGINLVGVEMSLTSLLKALDFCSLAETQMKENVSWNLMLINQNGYSICSMVGKEIIDYYEEPLAIKSFEGDEIYNAINASAQITLMSYPANYLYIVSETDMVSAELLAGRINVDCNVDYWENNSFRKKDPIPVSLEILESVAQKISLEAIGIAASNVVNMPVKFNFSGSNSLEGDNPDELVHIKIGNYEFEISPNQAKKIAGIIAGIILLPFFIAMFIVPSVLHKKQLQLESVNTRLAEVQAEVEKLMDEQNKSGDFDIDSEIKKVLANNRTKLMAYTALGNSVPKKLWLTYFVAKDDGKFAIKGESSNVENIYIFFKNMKDSMINTQLRLHKLELKSDSIDDAVSIDLTQSSTYEFEITNMSDAEMAPPADQQNAAPAEQPAQEQPAQEQIEKPGNLMNKPINLNK